MKEAAAVSEARSSSPPPALKDCVSIITASDASSPSTTRKKGELALSMLGFCYHMAVDQEKLSKLQSENKIQLSEIPAMRELLSNPALFNTMVSMLTPPLIPQGGNNSQQQMTIGRKRAPSEDFTHSRKRQMLSPLPNRQIEQKTQLPVESTSVLAATCLYTALQHVDHWPVQLMTAFAEDSFGPRIWVDDDRCSAIVANLEQSIKSHHDNTLTDAIVSAAEKAELYFSSLGTSSTTNKTTFPTAPAPSKQPSSKERRKLTADSKMNVDTSSSSGEEEVLESEVLPSFSMTSVQEQSQSSDKSSLQALFSFSSASNNEQARPRYVSSNVELMYEVISDAFEERLNSKSKQNSLLLQTLPLFLRIPRVRVLASRHLERWLQSPALAGLARTLFADIVNHIEKADPPLFDDLEVVDNILNLKLKANQLGIFVEHITAIVKKVPSVARQVFTYLISQEDSSNESAKDKLHILRAVYMTLDKKDASATLALSVIALESEMIEAGSKRDEVMLQYKDLHAHICKVVDTLGTSFDGFQFALSIVEAKMDGNTSKLSDVLNSSRLIFLCASLVARDISSLQNHDEEELSQYQLEMLKLRKSIMRWCMKGLCSVYHTKIIQEEERKCADAQFERGAVVSGPGVANYSSALDTNSHRNTSDHRSSFNNLMSIMRCLLFISHPSDMEFFLGPSLDGEHRNRVQFCCKYGVDIDDELIRLVLTSDTITPTTAISLIENIVERCNVDSTANVIDLSSNTVMDMYRLAEYRPLFRNKEVVTNSESADECSSDEDVRHETQIPRNLDVSSLPRLAVTSLWWRVSCIALALSGLCPNDVGAELWNQHPTLRALIRMTTSQKYRFPTAECDEAEKDKVKEIEAKTRETEANIVEKLFMPPKPRKTKQSKIKSPMRTGIRVSARQRERQERFRKIEEERNAAALHAEQLKLKKVLRSMQKNIMLFDPGQHQRKPPKGSIDLLLSVNRHFGLAEKFRQVTTPDFLLQTIGEGRSAIERAYDWLIPIISSHAEIIHRLQPNASCYLLLRAYGSAEGEKNSELLVLTKPLLAHVKGCLKGEQGESHAMLAMELLMSDIADERVTRRVCARRVLQEAFSGKNETSWLSQVIDDKHSAVFVPLVGRAVSRACAYERGGVLSTYVIALSKYRKSMQSNDFNFVSSLCELINNRPHVFGEALERFPELRRLCITEVKQAFDDAITPNKTVVQSESTAVTIFVKSQEYMVPSSLLGAFIVVMSNWQKDETTEDSEEDHIMTLLRQLVAGEKDSVLANALRKGKRAVSVTEWVSLSTSKSDIIAKQAALSVPDIFLPRLLLCCGMPRTTIYTMLERLSKLGESSSDPAKLYNELISTSAVSEWGLQKGSRITIKKRLHGRIASYLRIFSNAAADYSQDELTRIEKCAFVTWIATESSTFTSKKSDSPAACYDEILNFNSSASPSLDEGSFVDLEEEEMMDLCRDERMVIDIDESKNPNTCPINGVLTEEFVISSAPQLLHETLEQLKNDAMLQKKEFDASSLVRVLMNAYDSTNCDLSLCRMILKFVPQLSQFCCDDKLWQTIFIGTAEKSTDEKYLLSLVSGCVEHWSDEVIAACQKWILTQDELKYAFSMKLLFRFLVASSEQESIHCLHSNDECESNFVCVRSERNAESMMKMICKYIELTTDKSSGTSSEMRNNVPDWLLLTCIIAKSHQQCVVARIMKMIDSNSSCAPVMHSVLLRLYLMFPATLQWNDSKVRNYLTKSAKQHAKTSLRWRCPLDSQVIEMLSNLGTSPHPRLLQHATAISNAHALIVVRHIQVLHERLVTDGLGQDFTGTGRVGTRLPAATAQIDDRVVKVSIVRWGFSYTESIWSLVLDFMAALPADLLFTCGIETGVLLVLEDFLKLFYAHVMELGSEECISPLRPKYVSLVSSFRASNPVEFEKWSQSNLDGFGTVQTLLLSKVGSFAS